jgi:Fe2+ transport system protein FeoA
LRKTLLKLSEAKTGKKYKVEQLTLLRSLSKRLAILGLNTGVLIELIANYKHGAVIKTPFGDIAIDADLVDSILVSLV